MSRLASAQTWAPPPLLHVAGDLARLGALMRTPAVAIIGTRRATDYGLEVVTTARRRTGERGAHGRRSPRRGHRRRRAERRRERRWRDDRGHAGSRSDVSRLAACRSREHHRARARDLRGAGGRACAPLELHRTEPHRCSLSRVWSSSRPKRAPKFDLALPRCESASAARSSRYPVASVHPLPAALTR